MLSLPRSVPGWRRLVSQGIGWWLSELTGLMPLAVRRLAAAGRSDELVLRFGFKQITLDGAGNKATGPVVIPLQPGTDASASWVKQRFQGSAVQIVLDNDVIFPCAIELPASAEASMPQILRHQLERLVPLDPNSLSFIWWIAGRLPGRNALTVAVTIVRNTTLDQAASFARQMGLAPGSILIRQDNGIAHSVWRASVAGGSHRRRKLHRGIELATLALCVAAYAIYIIRLDTRREALRELLAPRQAEAQIVQQASQQLAKTQSVLVSINGRLAAPTPLTILDELTRRLPMDASISEFDLKLDRLSIIGTASHATALLSVLSASLLFYDPRFTAPITAAPDNVGEHFEISLRLRLSPR